MGTKAQVYIRVRNDSSDEEYVWKESGGKIYYENENNESVTYPCFTNIFSNKTNLEIYRASILGAVNDFMNGKNCTLFAYGQTGSGKTFTMFGSDYEEGLILLIIRDLLKADIGNIKISLVEIYNEKLYDMIDPAREIKLFAINGISRLTNCCNKEISTVEELKQTVEQCSKLRKTCETEFNSRSSRSHVVFNIELTTGVTVSNMFCIDLAGSEKATGDSERRKEGSYINKSLLALGTIVNNLANGISSGFRDSKLTRILQSSMDGNTRLVALCMLSPSRKSLEESISTLNFAARLSNIVFQTNVEKILSKKNKANIEDICEYCQCKLRVVKKDDTNTVVPYSIPQVTFNPSFGDFMSILYWHNQNACLKSDMSVSSEIKNTSSEGHFENSEFEYVIGNINNPEKYETAKSDEYLYNIFGLGNQSISNDSAEAKHKSQTIVERPDKELSALLTKEQNDQVDNLIDVVVDQYSSDIKEDFNFIDDKSETILRSIPIDPRLKIQQISSENSILKQKLLFFDSRINFLEKMVSILTSEQPNKKRTASLLLEKKLFDLKCELLENKHVTN